MNKARPPSRPKVRRRNEFGPMSGKNSYRTGAHVKWTWGSGEGTGRIRERFEHEVERTLKGSRIKRNGSEDDPAYLIEQTDGDHVLKLGSELKEAG